MLNQRLTAARNVRVTFLTAEEAQDAAAIHAARCVLTALEERSASKVPLGTGAEAIAHLSRAAQLSIEARNELILAHPKLAALPEEVGLAKMLGDVGPCPELRGSKTGLPLQSVA